MDHAHFTEVSNDKMPLAESNRDVGILVPWRNGEDTSSPPAVYG